MTPTMRWLLIAALSIFGLYGADSIYRSTIEEPTKALESQIDSTMDSMAKDKDDQLTAQRLGKRLDAYAARALPADPQLAKSLYQQWLLELVDKHELVSASVDAAQTIPVEIRSRTKKGKKQTIGYRIPFSVHGQATLSKIAAWLHEFRIAGHLQKIRSISLNPLGADGKVDMNISIEVLCLQSSANENQLCQIQLVEELPEDARSYDHLVKRNLFARGFAKALLDIRVKAITVNREGIIEAWMTLDARQSTRVFANGSQLPVPLHDLRIDDIQADRVLISVNQLPVWVPIGKSIGEILQSLENKESPTP